MHEIVYTLLRKAKAGNMQAARLLLERLFGPLSAQDMDERLARVNDLVERLIEEKHPADSLLFEQFMDELSKANNVA